MNGLAKPPTAPPRGENEKPTPTDADLDGAVAEAELVLRGKDLAADDIYELAEFLKQRTSSGTPAACTAGSGRDTGRI